MINSTNKKEKKMENENMEEKHPKKAQKLSYDIDHGGTVWFFSTATKDEGIAQKLDELAKFWKKNPGSWEFAVFCWKISRIFRKKYDLPDTCANNNEILQS